MKYLLGSFEHILSVVSATDCGHIYLTFLCHRHLKLTSQTFLLSPWILFINNIVYITDKLMCVYLDVFLYDHGICAELFCAILLVHRRLVNPPYFKTFSSKSAPLRSLFIFIFCSLSQLDHQCSLGIFYKWPSHKLTIRSPFLKR